MKNLSMKNLSIANKLAIIIVVSLIAVVSLTSIIIVITQMDINSLKSLNFAGQQVKETTVNLGLPMNNVRETSLLLVLAPNQQIKDNMENRLTGAVDLVDRKFLDFKNEEGADKDADLKITFDMWNDYKSLLNYTRQQVKKGYREAAFVNVSGPEKEQFSKLSTALTNWVDSKVASSETVFTDRKKAGRTLQMLSVPLGILVGAIVGLLGFWIARGIARPIVKLTDAMEALANGNIDVDVPDADRRDEIGKMADTVNIFKINAVKKIELEEEQRLSEEKQHAQAEERHQRELQDQKEREALQEQNKRQFEEERKVATLRMADDFQDKISVFLEGVTNATSAMQKVAASMVTTASDTSHLSHDADRGADITSANVQAMAGATEELSCSIEQISEQVAHQAQAAQTVMSSVRSSNKQVESLSESASQIGEVVSLINDIAEQTNLLALNATIEAARAGDAGRGFAVVASEVKNLASQTAKATNDIAELVRSIQNQTIATAKSFEEVVGEIDTMTEISGLVAASMDEQSSATRSISENVQEASSSTNSVANNIRSVNEAADKNEKSANDVLHSAEQVSEQIVTLRSVVDTFLNDVRVSA